MEDRGYKRKRVASPEPLEDDPGHLSSKKPKLDEDIVDELEDHHEMIPDEDKPKKASKVQRAGAAQKRENIKTSLLATAYALTNLISNFVSGVEEYFSFLNGYVPELVRSIEALTHGEDDPTLEGFFDSIRDKVLNQIPRETLELPRVTQGANEMQDYETLMIQNYTLPYERPSNTQLFAIHQIKLLFYSLLEKIRNPTAPVPDTSIPMPEINHSPSIGHSSNAACNGITSESINNGFKAYLESHQPKGEKIDLVIEESLKNGTPISVLRSINCQRVRSRGQMCQICRNAQNKWAVRLCRLRKNEAKITHTHEQEQV